jgi:uncharacterized protein YbjT (DUF2867 family)
MDKVLVAGASGRLGVEIVGELKRRGYSVRALVRDPARLAGRAEPDEVFAADARDPSALAGACEGVRVVVSALGASLALGRTKDRAGFREVDYAGNRNLLAEARRAGARRFVYVSMHGVEALPGVAYVEAHEEFVRELKSSGMDYTVVRPTGFFYVFGEVLNMARRGRGAVVGRGDARTNPVHERDVARACADAVEGAAREVSVGGPEVYTRREITELAFRALGRKPRVVSVPARLMRALVRPVGLFDRRLYELLDFGVAVGTVDVVAPRVGTHSLKDYFRQLAGGGA